MLFFSQFNLPKHQGSKWVETCICICVYICIYIKIILFNWLGKDKTSNLYNYSINILLARVSKHGFNTNAPPKKKKNTQQQVTLR